MHSKLYIRSKKAFLIFDISLIENSFPQMEATIVLLKPLECDYCVYKKFNDQ